MIGIVFVLSQRRKYSVLESDNEHDGKFQSFCAVHCSERNVIVVVHIVGIAVQRYHLQVILELCIGVFTHEFPDRPDKFVEIFEPRSVIVVFRKQIHNV